MRVLIIRPPVKKNRKVLFNSNPYRWMYPLRLAYIAAELKEIDVTVGFIDCPLSNYDPLSAAGAVFSFHADIIYCELDENSAEFQMKFLTNIKQLTASRIIVGGTYASFFHDKLCTHFPAIDAIIRGEPDETFIDIISSVSEGFGIDYLQGVTTPGTKQFLVGPQRPFLQDLDNLPFPDRETIPFRSYQKGCVYRGPVALIAGTRGCMQNCVFCRLGKKNIKLRLRSPNNIAVEAEQLVRQYKVKEIRFVDSVFNANSDWSYALAELLTPLGVTWSCSCNAKQLNQQLLRAYRRAGCRDIFFSSVCPTKESAEKLQVTDDPEAIKKILSLAAFEDIRLHIRIISGNEPLPSFEEAQWFASSLTNFDVNIRSIHPHFDSSLESKKPKTFIIPPENHDMRFYSGHSFRSLSYWRKYLYKFFRKPKREACLEHGPERLN